jgi:hypothetical protein
LARGIEAGKVIGRAALRPNSCAVSPCIEFARRISRRQRVITPLQPRIDHIAGEIGDIRPALGVDIGDGDAGRAQQFGEARRVEAVVANLDDVVELASLDLAGQQIQELAEIDFVKALEGRELPDERPELVAEFQQP